MKTLIQYYVDSYSQKYNKTMYTTSNSLTWSMIPGFG